MDNALLLGKLKYYCQSSLFQKENPKPNRNRHNPYSMQSFLAGYIDSFFPNHSDDFSPPSVAVHCGGVKRKENCASFRLGFRSCSRGGWLSLLRWHGMGRLRSASAQLLPSAPLPRIPIFGGGSHPVVGKVHSVILRTCPCWK